METNCDGLYLFLVVNRALRFLDKTGFVKSREKASY